MSLNSEQEKKSLKDSLKNTENLQETLVCLESILVHRTPFALYIATADRTDCTWIFDPQTIYQMVGGEDKYDSIFSSLFPTEEDKSVGIVFFIFKKVGPLYSIRVDIDLIDEIINDLYDDV
jgi:hypothetical protein